MVSSRCRSGVRGPCADRRRPRTANAAHAATGGGARRSLLLLPIASGSPGQEWSARALGGILEEGFGSLGALRLVGGPAREGALRGLSSGATLPPDEFFAVCRRAGADLAVLGGAPSPPGS